MRLTNDQHEGLLSKLTDRLRTLAILPASGFSTVRPGKGRMAGVVNEFAQIADSIASPYNGKKDLPERSHRCEVMSLSRDGRMP